MAGQTALPAGTLLNARYQIISVIGEGGFGITYRALDSRDGKLVCVKEYFPSGQYRRLENSFAELMSSELLERDHVGKNKFIEEYAILESLKDVPGVVQPVEKFDGFGTSYIVMEMLEGEDLRSMVKGAGHGLPQEEVTGYILEVARTLDIIHQKAGIIHCDVSPENIFITHGRAMMIDFGAAEFINDPEGKSHVQKQLKPSFAPPEQFDFTKKEGPFSDVYSLAATYYYCLTGRFVTRVTDRLKGQPYTPLCKALPGMQKTISDAVDKALLLDTGARTASMKEFASGINPAERNIKEKESHIFMPFVVVRTGPSAGKRWVIPVNAPLIIGRHSVKANLVISGQIDISREHCRVLYDAASGKFQILDMSSLGTVYLRGGREIRLQKGVEYDVSPPATFFLASRECVIELGVQA